MYDEFKLTVWRIKRIVVEYNTCCSGVVHFYIYYGGFYYVCIDQKFSDVSDIR